MTSANPQPDAVPGEVIVNVFGRTDVGRVRDHNEDAHFKVMQEYKNEQMNEDEVNHYMNMHREGGVDNPKQARRV